MSYSSNQNKLIRRTRIFTLIIGIILIGISIWLGYLAFGNSALKFISAYNLYSILKPEKLQVIFGFGALILLNYGIFLVAYWKTIKSVFSQANLHFTIASTIGLIIVGLNILLNSFITGQFSISILVFAILTVYDIKRTIDVGKFTKSVEFKNSMIANTDFEKAFPYLSLIIWVFIGIVGVLFLF